MSSDRVNILGVNVDMLTINEAAARILSFLDSDGIRTVYTPNSEIIMQAYKNEDFKNLLNRADVLTADGIGVVYASRMLKKPITERAAGYDISKKVLCGMKDSGHSLFLFGGKPGVAEKAAENMRRDYPGINIAGTHSGYFKPEELDSIIDKINSSGADMLFVCLGAPAQEKWIDQNRSRLNVKVAMGLGGSIDVFAETVLRAPDFWCNHGLEWFYRLIKEPWRFWRMMALPKFALTVLIKGKRYGKEEV